MDSKHLRGEKWNRVIDILKWALYSETRLEGEESLGPGDYTPDSSSFLERPKDSERSHGNSFTFT